MTVSGIVLFPAVRVAESAFEKLAANRSARRVARAAVEFLEVYRAGQAREHICDGNNEDLSGEVPSATRRGMQPYCVKCLLYVSYVE